MSSYDFRALLNRRTIIAVGSALALTAGGVSKCATGEDLPEPVKEGISDATEGAATLADALNPQTAATDAAE